jgi:hypothetical protein
MKPKIVFFIDIDGTLTNGTHREVVMEELGLVSGAYGDPNRKYPKGKRAFLEAFAAPTLFQKDTTMPGAFELTQMISNLYSEYEINVFFLTARDGLYHSETEIDLKDRGLWLNGSRLICKPHNQAPITTVYKSTIVSTICEALTPGDVLLIDNSQKILQAVVRETPCTTAFSNCTDALKWCEKNLQSGWGND